METLIRPGTYVLYKGSQVLPLIEAGYSPCLYVLSIDDGRLTLADIETDKVLLRKVRKSSVTVGCLAQVFAWNTATSCCHANLLSEEHEDELACEKCGAPVVASTSMQRRLVDGKWVGYNTKSMFPSIPVLHT
jgi:hypothetical protein